MPIENWLKNIAPIPIRLIGMIKNKGASYNVKLLSIFLIGFSISISCKKEIVPMVITSTNPMVQSFYNVNHKMRFWLSSEQKREKANEWLNEMESARSFGFDADELQINMVRDALKNQEEMNDSLKDRTDQQITGLVLYFIKVLQQNNIEFDYDEVSTIPKDSVYIHQLLNFKTSDNVSEFVTSLEGDDPDYWVLKNYLKDSITANDTLKYKSVLLALNYRKYLTDYHQLEYVVVNIPEGEARYYNNGLLTLSMRTVAGKTYAHTPTIASYITNIVTFPSWNVPHSIAVKEILPKVQKDEIYLDQNNLEVIDAKGILVEDSVLNWDKYTAKNFPFYFRQSTGAKNSLGVLKFDLENPFSIYLHSTSVQSAFAKKYRFLSHGCIRLEKPIDLAMKMLRGKLDIEELKKGKKDTVSKKIVLPNKVPVFIIYSPAIVLDNKVAFLPDVYGLIK